MQTWINEDLTYKCLGSLGEHDVYVALNLVKSVEVTPGPVIPGYEEKVQK